MTKLCDQCQAKNCNGYISDNHCYKKLIGKIKNDKNLINCKSECEKKNLKEKKNITNLKKKIEVNNKKIEILKLTDKKSQCSNDDLSKLLSSDDISYKKWPSYECTKFIPNSSILTYENAKNSCNLNKNCQAISNKNCNKQGFKLCSSSVIKYTKDCGCVYIKNEKELDRLGKSDRDIKYAVSLVKKDPRCPSTHPFRSNLLIDLNDTKDLQSGNKCFNRAACGASKRSYYKQLSLGFKCNDIDIKSLNEDKKIKKTISNLQQERILLDYKISKNKNKKNDLAVISKENTQLLNILQDDLTYKKNEVKDTNNFIENKKKQIKKLESIKKTHIKSLLNLNGKDKQAKIKVIERLDVKINENKKSLKELENNLGKKIENVFSLTEKILLTKKNAIK